MKKKTKNNFAYTESNHKGFSLISVLVSLSLVIMALQFIPLVFASLNQPSYYSELSVRQFFHFVTNELNQSYDISHTPTAITMKRSSGEIVTYEKYGDIIRRQVRGTGHEILVRDINDFQIRTLSFGIKIIITTTNGEMYEKTIPVIE